MAIDTAEKRRNVSGLLTGVLPCAVTPNASKDVEWRQEAGWGYSGILPSGAVVAAAGGEFINITRRRRRR